MDINSLYTVDLHEQGAEMQIKDQNGKPLKMYLMLMGTDSKTFRDEKLKHERRMLIDKKVNEVESMAEVFAESTINWRGFLNDGKEFSFTKKRAKDLYINAPYLIDQINVFVADRKNFTKG